MSKLIWDKTGEHFYETGVKMGVLYPTVDGGAYGAGVAWNGLTAVTESPSGAEANPFYADDIKYLNLYSVEELGGTIEAYTYPDEFGACNGEASPIRGVKMGQQKRRAFGMCYRTIIGNDTDGNDYGYKLHLLYGVMTSPSERAYTTVNDSPEPSTFSWEFTTTPVAVDGFKPTSLITIDSTQVDAACLTALEEILYGKNATTEGGNDGVEPRLPMPDEVQTIMAPAED